MGGFSRGRASVVHAEDNIRVIRAIGQKQGQIDPVIPNPLGSCRCHRERRGSDMDEGSVITWPRRCRDEGGNDGRGGSMSTKTR